MKHFITTTAELVAEFGAEQHCLLWEIWNHKGVIGVIATPTWSLLAQADMVELPPGGSWTLHGLMAIAIMYLVKELRAWQKKFDKAMKKCEEKLDQQAEKYSRKLDDAYEEGRKWAESEREKTEELQLKHEELLKARVLETKVEADKEAEGKQ